MRVRQVVLQWHLATIFTSLAAAEWYERGARDCIVQELGQKLSSGAEITLRGEDGYAEKSKRWESWKAPDVAAVVDVKTEVDVQETVKYANKYDIPFFPYVGGHGSVLSLGDVKNGIQISMGSLNDVKISEDGTSATLGGGIKGKEVTDALWPYGKQTVTGICECVGLPAVALGGGLGILQGNYGLLSDQILSLNLVIANSSVITVSPTSHPDLFWALQGAGHNFGIVTSLEYKIYDVDALPGKGVWSYEVLSYPATPENVRRVYGIAQEMLDTQPKGMLQYALVLLNPEISEKPIILHHVVYNGPLSELAELTKAYHDLEPIAVAKEESTYVDIPRYVQVDKDNMVCKLQDAMPGAGIIRFPVNVKRYNIDALAKAVEHFTTITTTVPEFAGSFMIIEQYSTHEVRRKDPSKSSYPAREDRLLLAPALLFPAVDPATNVPNIQLEDLAYKYGNELRQILIDGAKVQDGSTSYHSYVNYAYGGESLEDIYGKENLERLKKLKKEYDPENKFGFYVPIESEREGKGHDEL